MILVLRRSRSGLTLTFSGLWSFTLLSEPVSQAGEIFKPAARGSLAKTACWWAANVHQRPSALSSSKTRWPSGAWDRELGSLEGCTGSNCLGAKHATGRSPILLLPARHAACGGRRNRKRGIRVVTKKIAHTTREEGDLAIYCVITGTDSLNWPWLTVLPTEPKLLYCLFAPTTGPHHC